MGDETVQSKTNVEKVKKKKSRAKKKPRINRPYPRVTLEESLSIPITLKEKNGGNPWPPEQVSKAAYNIAKSNKRFFYYASSAREFGLTEGSRDSDVIELTDLGRELVYAPDPETESKIKKQAFLNVEIFKKVLDYYQGAELPEMKYLSNTLEKEFGLHPDTHDEFSELFRKNCEYLSIGSGFSANDTNTNKKEEGAPATKKAKVHSGNVITLAEPEKKTGLSCFVAMPFSEKTGGYQNGFFDEVLKHLIVPAGRNAGFKVITAKRKGTDVIQSTIVNDLLNADLVVADLTEHNPNVLFELGMRMAFDKPVALIRAEGTSSIFDVDNMLRVLEYKPNLWPSTVEKDLPKLSEHIKASWENKEDINSFMKILSQTPAKMG